jgi:hypothetical protein
MAQFIIPRSRNVFWEASKGTARIFWNMNIQRSPPLDPSYLEPDESNPNTIKINFKIVNTSSLGLEKSRGGPLRYSRDTLYPQKLALTSSTYDGRSVSVVRLRTKATEW